MNAGQRMKDIRLAMNLKQASVASDIGTTQQAYSICERQSNFNVSTIFRYCAAVGISLEFFFSDIPATAENLKLYGKMVLKQQKVLEDIKDAIIVHNHKSIWHQ